MEWKQVMKDLADHGRTCLLLREIKSHWGVLSTGVIWLTWLPFNKITLPCCQKRLERAGGEAGRAAGRTRVVVLMRCEQWGWGCELREWGDILWIMSWSGASGIFWKCGVWCERKRSWGWLQSCWPFWRKEFSTGMKDCRKACLGEKIRSSVLGKLGLRCLWKYQALSLDLGK